MRGQRYEVHELSGYPFTLGPRKGNAVLQTDVFVVDTHYNYAVVYKQNAPTRRGKQQLDLRRVLCRRECERLNWEERSGRVR